MTPQPPQDSADRRTQRAADRTVFAAERTYAAWVRTGLAALASGVGACKLLEAHVPEWVIVLGRTVLILVNAAPIVVALSARIAVWFGRAGAGLPRRRGPHPAAVPVPRRSRARPS
jgi:putative membrane protein